jgi:cytochrome b subunit of formate dehydrogenase
MVNRARPRLAFGSALLGVLFAAAGRGVGAANDIAPGCALCHEQAQQLLKSVHAGLSCDTCHEGHEKYPHAAGIPKPECTNCHPDQAGDYASGVHGQARSTGSAGRPDCGKCHGSAHEMLPPKSQSFRAAVPDTCGMCHFEIAQQFRASVHGQALARGITQAPLCTDCHDEHKILKHTNAASPVFQGNIRNTCGSCHGDVRLTRKFRMAADRLVSFDASFHGLAAKAGSQTVANCASCHGVHNILPSSDPKSTIHANNLPKTCGQCHAGAGTRFAISQVHLTEGRAAPGVRWVRRFYLWLIPVTLGLMLIHNAGDWIRKLLRARFRGGVAGDRGEMAGETGELQMLPFERVLHAVLGVSFLTLAWTGFALKYPDQWWARPLLLLEGAQSVRSLIHRSAAMIFLAAAVTHVVSLIVSRHLRQHWKALLPHRNDVREALAGFAHSLGLGPEAPVRSSYSYVEKAEYWALIWGTVVMAATGLMLWANNIALKLFPKIWLDVATLIHFYEAILAGGAIVIWHFYSTVFDPDVYPLDTAFLTGFSVKRESTHSTDHSTGQAHAGPEPQAGARKDVGGGLEQTE